MTENKKPKSRKRGSSFGAALVEAERKLARMLNERNDLAIRYHEVNAEIPKLEKIIAAFRNQQNAVVSYPQQQYAPVPPDYSMEHIMSDVPIPIRPPVVSENGTIPLPAMPEMPRPPLARVGGGAVGFQGGDQPEPEDENKYLNEAQLPGGNWQ